MRRASGPAGQSGDCSEASAPLAIHRMEAEVVEDKKKAKPCDCGHPAAVHEKDGVGHCKVCDCPGPGVAEDAADAVSDDGDDAVL